MMWIGSILGLAAATCWACSNLCIQASSRQFGSWGALILAQIIGAPVVAFVAWHVHGVPGVFTAPEALLLLAAGLCAVGGYGGLFRALAIGQVSVVIPIVVSWTVVSAIASIVFLGQQVSLLAWVGIGVILLSNGLVAHGSQTDRPADAPATTPKTALLAAAMAALCFGGMMPIISVLGESKGALWALPLVWTTELFFLLPFRRPEALPGNVHEWWLAGRVALFETLGFGTFCVGMSIAPVALVAPLSSLGSAFSVLLGLFFLRERVPRLVMLGAGLATSGVIVVHF